MKKLLSPRKYELHFSKNYLKRKITLTEVASYFSQLELSKTYFILLPLEILYKIYIFKETKRKIEIPHTKYVALLKAAITSSSMKLKRWLLKHHEDVIFIYDVSGYTYSQRRKYDRHLLMYELNDLMQFLIDTRRCHLYSELSTFFYN